MAQAATSNRMGLSFVRESTPGVTPGSPRMRTCRITGEQLALQQDFAQSDEIRSDRMTADDIALMRSAQGTANVELSYPVDNSWISELLRSALFNSWSNAPVRDNDGTPDSVITDIGTTANTIAFLTGAAFAVGHLVLLSGFANPANNGIQRVTTGGATSLVASAAAFVAEAVPPAAARVKVVGFQGTAGDIAATASGLSSTALNFTTLGLAPGMLVKVGGSAATDRFITQPQNNGWARVAAVSPNALTLDNLPVGWAADTGTGRTIKVWFGDEIKNGVTPSSMSIEKGFLDQSVPSYILHQGMQVDQISISLTNRQKATLAVTFAGMGGAASTSTVDAIPDAPTINQVMASHANVGQISEGGAATIGSNFGKSLTIAINNNTRPQEALELQSPIGINPGEATVTIRGEFGFTDLSLINKFQNNTPTSIIARLQKNGQAIVFQIPRLIYNSDGNPQGQGKNQDVTLPLGGKASADPLTVAHLIVDRLEYYEA